MFMKYTGPGVKFKNMFEDSHDETIYYVVSAFEQKLMKLTIIVQKEEEILL